MHREKSMKERAISTILQLDRPGDEQTIAPSLVYKEIKRREIRGNSCSVKVSQPAILEYTGVYSMLYTAMEIFTTVQK